MKCVKICEDCGDEFEFEAERTCDAGIRRFCDECARDRKNVKSHPGRPTMTKAQRKVAERYSPFTPYGPKPLPKDKVPPHRCSEVVHMTTDIEGRMLKTHFRR